MNPVNYAEMTDLELKQYFLSHRDEEAFQAYLERYRSQPREVITKVGDPDFDLKIQVAIQQKMQAHRAQRDRNN
jgi:predicted metal-dependent RNase